MWDGAVSHITAFWSRSHQNHSQTTEFQKNSGGGPPDPPPLGADFAPMPNTTLTPPFNIPRSAPGHTVLLSCCLTVILSHCPTVSLSCCPTVSLSCCLTVLLSCCLTVLLSHCSTVLLSHCPTATLSCCLTIPPCCTTRTYRTRVRCTSIHVYVYTRIHVLRHLDLLYLCLLPFCLDQTVNSKARTWCQKWDSYGVLPNPCCTQVRFRPTRRLAEVDSPI